MDAERESLFSFTKKTGWEIDPPEKKKKKTDFRDPEAYFDVESKKIILTVTASKNNIARILKFSRHFSFRVSAIAGYQCAIL